MDAAYEGFEQVAQSDAEGSGDWPFKAKKQMIKILFAQGKRDQVLEQYTRLLDYLGDNKLSSSYAEKSFTNMLDLLTATKKGSGASGQQLKKGLESSSTSSFVEKIYVTTLSKLVAVKNERMWIKTNLKLAKLYSDQGQVQKALAVLVETQERCKTGRTGPAADENNLKSSYLMEVYAQMITLYSGIGDYKKMKEIYRQTESLKSAVPHPRILGVISEAGGKMQMREKRYELAREAFFDSFKNYDEAGSLQRIAVLKYYVVACMLSETKINPFESQETRPYRNDPKIAVMVQLVEAFQRNDLDEFQKLFRDQGNAEEIMGDPFIREFLGDIEFSAQALGVLRLVRPYTRIKFAKIASALQIPESLVVEILKSLVFTSKLPLARLDSRGEYVELNAAAVDINLNSHYQLIERQSRNGNDDNKVTDLAQARFSIGNESALDGLDDSNSTVTDRAPYVGTSDGGLAPLLGVYQPPGRTLMLNTKAQQSVDEFVSSLSGPLMLNSRITDALAKIAAPEAASQIKSNVLKDCVINVSPGSARTNVVFDIPRRYVQAAISEASAGTTKDSTKDGNGNSSAAGNGNGNGGAAGAVGGSDGDAGEGPSSGDKVSGSGGDGLSGSIGGAGAGSGALMEGGFSSGAVDPNNPFVGRIQSGKRTLALVGWARAVERLQQATERGEGTIPCGEKMNKGYEWRIASEFSSNTLRSFLTTNGPKKMMITGPGSLAGQGKQGLLTACQQAAAEAWN